MKRQLVKIKSNSLPVISLFLKWFLLEETLFKNVETKKSLEKMKEETAGDEEQWADSVRQQLTGEALKVLSRTLDRPLSSTELLFLFEKVDEFIQLYEINLKKGAETAPLKNEEGETSC